MFIMQSFEETVTYKKLHFQCDFQGHSMSKTHGAKQKRIDTSSG